MKTVEENEIFFLNVGEVELGFSGIMPRYEPKIFFTHPIRKLINKMPVEAQR